MQIGIGIPNQVRNVNPAIIPEWSSRAEAAGFNTLGTIGRFAYPGVSDTVALAAAAGTRELPFLFGGSAPVAMARMAKWGQGYVGGSMPASMVAQAFDGARAAWKDAGREGAPRLVAVAYFAFADGDQGRANVHDYYS